MTKASNKMTLTQFANGNGMKLDFDQRPHGLANPIRLELKDECGNVVRAGNKDHSRTILVTAEGASKEACMKSVCAQIKGKFISFTKRGKGNEADSSYFMKVTKDLVPYSAAKRDAIVAANVAKRKQKAKQREAEEEEDAWGEDEGGDEAPSRNPKKITWAKFLKANDLHEVITKQYDGVMLSLAYAKKNQPLVDVTVAPHKKLVVAWGKTVAPARLAMVDYLLGRKLRAGALQIDVPFGLSHRSNVEPSSITFHQFLAVADLREGHTPISEDQCTVLVIDKDNHSLRMCSSGANVAAKVRTSNPYETAIKLLTARIKGTRIAPSHAVGESSTEITVPLNLIPFAVTKESDVEEEEPPSRQEPPIGVLANYEWVPTGETMIAMRIEGSMFLAFSDKNGACFRPMLVPGNDMKLLEVWQPHAAWKFFQTRSDVYRSWEEGALQKPRGYTNLVSVIGTGDTLEQAQERSKNLPNTAIVAVCECDGKQYIKSATTDDKNVKEYWILAMGEQQ